MRIDDSLFSGPSVSPDWPATYVGSGVVSRVSALSVDGGRVKPDADAREPDPAMAAGRDLAKLLAARGITVTGSVRRTTSPAGARTLAQVLSPTVAELVEAGLSTSDNDLAESLLRLSAIAQGRPGTSTSATEASCRTPNRPWVSEWPEGAGGGFADLRHPRWHGPRDTLPASSQPVRSEVH